MADRKQIVGFTDPSPLHAGAVAQYVMAFREPDGSVELTVRDHLDRHTHLKFSYQEWDAFVERLIDERIVSEKPEPIGG